MSDKLTVRFNPDDLDFDALIDFEKVTGKTLEKALKPVRQYDEETGELIVDEKGRPKMAPDISMEVLAAITWVTHRQNVDPSFTWEQARKVKPAVLEIVVPEDDPEGEGEAASV